MWQHNIYCPVVFSDHWRQFTNNFFFYVTPTDNRSLTIKPESQNDTFNTIEWLVFCDRREILYSAFHHNYYNHITCKWKEAFLQCCLCYGPKHFRVIVLNSRDNDFSLVMLSVLVLSYFSSTMQSCCLWWLCLVFFSDYAEGKLMWKPPRAEFQKPFLNFH